MQHSVPSQIDHAEPAGANRLDDLKLADAGDGCGGGSAV
jgi:hypothetical protein